MKEIVNSRIADIILTESGEVRPYARVLVNGRSHQFVGGFDADFAQELVQLKNAVIDMCGGIFRPMLPG